ncbi:MAG: polysaccharide biosynthesis protein [Bacteroidales bacterium]|nr:polysaccharide biosynthesis protein [Bacteroidales bacterium]
MSVFNKIARYFNKFLNAGVIFVMDTVLSLLASLLALLLLGYFRGTTYTTGHFALIWILSSLAATLAAKLIFKSHQLIIRHTTFNDMIRFVIETFSKVLLMGLVIYLFKQLFSGVFFALLADFFLTIFLLLALRLLMISGYEFYKNKRKEEKNTLRVLVYRTSDKSLAAVMRLKNSKHYKILGFISSQKQTKQMILLDLPIYDYSEVEQVVQDLSIDAILFTTDRDAQYQRDRLVRFCYDHKLRPLIIPSIDEVPEDGNLKSGVRKLRIEDLLGREEIKIEMDKITATFQGKVVMVTGAAGSIGSELCRQLVNFNVSRLILFDNAETPMHNFRLEMEEKYPEQDFVPVIGDVRHQQRLDFAFRKYKPQVVFHAAAYKHVPLMEENPCEAVQVNVFGTHNVADKCIEYGVEKMVMISTDKAVNPTNIMGCTKRLAEIYIQSLGLAVESGKKVGKTTFVTTRFGNVLGSNGSVIPRFAEQIAKGGPVTVTHPEITRFFMTIPEACRLVMEAVALSTGTQIFAFDMGEQVKIDNLARHMIELAGYKPDVDIKIEYTGLRPGEKLYEEVLSNSENTIETEHKSIFIAKARKYEYEDVLPDILELEDLSVKVNIPDMVVKMKQIVPEYISNNSVFEQYDKA